VIARVFGVRIAQYAMDSDRGLFLTLPVTAGAPSLAQDAVGGLGGLSEEMLSDLRLVVGELVSNVIEHAGLSAQDVLSVAVEEGETQVTVKVGDPGSGFTLDHARDTRRRPDTRALGLFIVEQFSERWGIDRGDEFTVWAEIGKH
jgi:anti-sigma regulatory factor (Ser/Thr protein kinase)